MIWDWSPLILKTSPASYAVSKEEEKAGVGMREARRTEYGKQKERRAGGKPGLGLEAVWVLSRLAHLVPES